MQTAAHAIINVALLDRRGYAGRAWPILAGAIVCDLPNFVFFVATVGFGGMSSDAAYADLYHRPDVELWFLPFHAIPIGAAILAVGLWRRNLVAQAFGLSFIAHCVADFIVHAQDAHAHFFPFSDYRFYGPFSYWDRAHGAQWVAAVELLVVLLSAALIWRRYRDRRARIVVAVVAIASAIAYATGFVFWGT